MADQLSVERARAGVASAFNRRLKDVYNTRLNIQGAGDKQKARNLPPVDPDTGAFTADEHKPPAWLVAFQMQPGPDGVAAGPTHGRRPNRLVATYNTTTANLQGFLARVIPVYREALNGGVRYTRHPYWEWALGFVFPGPATFIQANMSAVPVDFDPVTGELSATARRRRYQQPYIWAGLFGLVPGDEVWSPSVPITYGLATAALAAYVRINADPNASAVSDVDADEPEPEDNVFSNVEDLE